MTSDTAHQTAAPFRTIPEFTAARQVRPRGARHHAVRTATGAYKQRFKTRSEIITARSVDIAAASNASNETA
jgi:hypothetical protein